MRTLVRAHNESPTKLEDISLGRRPVKQGLDGAEHYLYRGEVVNNAIKMAGGEVNLFRDKAEVTHKMDFSDLSDEELILRLRDEAEALLLERRAAGLDSGDVKVDWRPK